MAINTLHKLFRDRQQPSIDVEEYLKSVKPWFSLNTVVTYILLTLCNSDNFENVIFQVVKFLDNLCFTQYIVSQWVS